MDTHGTQLSNLHLLSVRLLETQVGPPLGSPTASSIRGRAHSYDLHAQLPVDEDKLIWDYAVAAIALAVKV
jgi:hypothetical protein